MTLTLNKAQLEVISCIHRPCLVIAGAGSGKTYTICHKIEQLINLGYKVVAVTFTNKAAHEMKARLSQLKRPARKMTILTFHRLGLRIIERFGVSIGYHHGFSLLDEADKLEMIQECVPPMHKDDLQELSYKISKIKHYAALPEFLKEIEPPMWGIFEKYEQLLLATQSLDLDDLVYKAYRLSCLPGVQEALKSTFDYWLIDEYQDTNIAQYLLFKNLADPLKFTLVGDDDQSIYSWRGAHPKNLDLAINHFEALKIIKLEENYRCAPKILQAANSLIANNSHLFPKSLYSNKTEIGTLTLTTFAQEQEEADEIAASIATRTPSQTVAILFRTNYQSMIFEKACQERQIPYQLLGATSLFQNKEIKDLVAYLRVLINPLDDQAFKRLLNTPKRGLAAHALEQIVNYAQTHKLSLRETIGKLAFLHNQSSKVAHPCSLLHQLLEKYQQKLQTADSLNWIQELLGEIEYSEWIVQNYPTKKQSVKRQEALNDFVKWIEHLYTKEKSLGPILQKILVIDLLDKQETTREARLTLSTIHAAKGLEFDHVYLVGSQEGLLPHENSLDSLGSVYISKKRKSDSVGLAKTTHYHNMDYHLKSHEWQTLFSILSKFSSIRTKNEARLKLFIEAIWFIARSGCQWRLLPPVYGHWRSVHQRFIRWSKKGLWQQLFQDIQDPDLQEVMIDGTSIRAHACSSGYKKDSQEEQCLGRSKGGFTTKIHALVDALGYPLKFSLTSGQRHEITQANLLTQDQIADCLIGDKAYDKDAFVEGLSGNIKKVVIPPRKNRKRLRDYDLDVYKERHLIECFFGKLKHFRRIFSRFDKAAHTFLSFIHFVSTLIWAR